MRCRSVQILALLLLLTASGAAQSDVLDRIAAVINGKVVITVSDIRREREVMRALGKDPGSDDMVLQTLIDRYLVEEQISLFPGLEVSEEALKERLAQVKNPGNVPPEQLRRAAFEEIRLSEFLIQRFRQFIRISDDEVKAFYEKTFVPAVQEKKLPVPPMETVVEDIRRELAGQKLDNELRTWLEGLRRRNDIEIFQ
jgi:parvulin-like peptidyl-prolyl isomerase